MKKEFIHYPNVLSKERCEALVAKYKSLPMQKALIGGKKDDPTSGTLQTGKASVIPKEDLGLIDLGHGQEPDKTAPFPDGIHDTSIRSSTIQWIQNTPEHTAIFDIVWKYALHANQHYFGFHIDDLPSLQFTEYDAAENGKYDRHQDTFWLRPDGRHRKLSMVIQLTDPDTYEGGDFEVYGTSENASKWAFKGQGTIIFFPSLMDHAALPVTKGVRNSLVGWFEGPSWR